MSVYRLYNDTFENTIISDSDNIEKIAQQLHMNYELISESIKTKDIDDIALLKAKLKAQTERSDFIEECIAEMAGVVYNTEETTT